MCLVCVFHLDVLLVFRLLGNLFGSCHYFDTREKDKILRKHCNSMTTFQTDRQLERWIDRQKKYRSIDRYLSIQLECRYTYCNVFSVLLYVLMLPLLLIHVFSADQPSFRPTDGQTGSQGTFTSNKGHMGRKFF